MGYGVFSAVVGDGVNATHDGHDCVNSIDGDVSVSNVEGDGGEVGVVVGELAFGQIHVSGAGSSSGSRSRTAEGEVVFGIKFGLFLTNHDAGDFVAVHCVLFAVVIFDVVVTHDGHGCSDRGDGLVTVGHVEGDIGEVGIDVGEHIGGQAHVGRAVRVFAFHHVGSASRSRTAEGEIVGSIKFGLFLTNHDAGDFVAVHFVFFAVVSI